MTPSVTLFVLSAISITVSKLEKKGKIWEFQMGEMRFLGLAPAVLIFPHVPIIFSSNV